MIDEPPRSETASDPLKVQIIGEVAVTGIQALCRAINALHQDMRLLEIAVNELKAVKSAPKRRRTKSIRKSRRA
jgi:hypothetical protein